tara:strand:- start:2148 stop:2297 length:150 start_codon:yes stop_codon:yes gene_type:complete
LDLAEGARKEGFMRLLTPFTIPKKENCDLCRFEKNNKKSVDNYLLDYLF